MARHRISVFLPFTRDWPIAGGMGNSATKKRWLEYKVGDEDVGGLLIVKIVHQGPRGAIYLTAGDKKFGHGLNWDEEDNLGPHWNRSIAAALNLLTPVRTIITDPAERERALMMISAGLIRALYANPGDVEQDFLTEAADFIKARQREILQIRYFTAAAVAAVALFLFVLLIAVMIKSWPLFANNMTPGIREFGLAAFLGGAGAMISVSQRFRSIEIEHYMSGLLATLGGLSRILFGTGFGAVFLLFQKAGIVLSAANQQPWLLAAAALVAGFSERAIPEVLARFERQIIAGKSLRQPAGH